MERLTRAAVVGISVEPSHRACPHSAVDSCLRCLPVVAVLNAAVEPLNKACHILLQVNIWHTLVEVDCTGAHRVPGARIVRGLPM
jgi:hypothetical protein